MAKINRKEIIQFLKRIGKPALFILYIALNAITFNHSDSEKDFEYYKILMQDNSKGSVSESPLIIKNSPLIASA